MNFPKWLSSIEAKIIDRVITEALAKGLVISVYDGEEYPVKRSADRSKIQSEVGQTDLTTLVLRHPNGDHAGSVLLIHGNDEDVICDHSDNELMAELCREFETC